jgi:hypothetical protein
MAVRMLGNVVFQDKELKGAEINSLRKAAIFALITYGKENASLISEIVLSDCEDQLPGF